ncbi:MAG: hypothetical protein ACFE9L_06370 [Candidatus Hodarchaeota archaeon]
MIFALGTPINAKFKPWTYDWATKPDALMISAIDFFDAPKIYQKVKKIGIHEYLGWNGQIICDSGAFSAMNRRKPVKLDISRLRKIYKELITQDSSIIRITLDFPDEKILSNYKALSSLGVQPVVPYNRLDILDSVLGSGNLPSWIFIGRLVPLMRKGRGHSNRLLPVLDDIKDRIRIYDKEERIKIWTLGVGAPSLMSVLKKKVDGCDSARWRITGSNMILLPKGGERGVGNVTKWRGTQHRIGDGLERKLVIKILKHIDMRLKGLEKLDKTLGKECSPKQLKGRIEKNLPTVGYLLEKLRNNKDEMSVYELELLLRTSGNLRLLFNYWAALTSKTQ